VVLLAAFVGLAMLSVVALVCAEIESLAPATAVKE
jgi:hypothetical protein